MTIDEAYVQTCLDVLADMVQQHCRADDGTLSTGALVANADAVRLLAAHRRVEIIGGCGNNLRFRWRDQATATETTR